MIAINHLSFKYPGTNNRVFDDFNMKIERNKIYGLLGKNGTGKSTLLYLISGMMRANSGEILVDGTNANERRPEILSDLFLVPEEFELPDLTLDTYVKINSPFYPRFDHEVLERCLQEFELPSTLKLKELSMGQKKKVFMSFALASGTRYLLMDEPTNGLDIPSKTQFRKVVTHNMTEERTLIISTHQVHDVESLLDHLLILSEKRLLLDADTSEICEKYSFGVRNPGETEGVLYAEPSLQGNQVVALRQEDEAETALNLELLFNAVVEAKISL